MYDCEYFLLGYLVSVVACLFGFHSHIFSTAEVFDLTEVQLSKCFFNQTYFCYYPKNSLPSPKELWDVKDLFTILIAEMFTKTGQFSATVV